MISKSFLKVLIVGLFILLLYILYVSRINIKSFYSNNYLINVYRKPEVEPKVSVLSYPTMSESATTKKNIKLNYNNKSADLIYILLWTASDSVPFSYIGKGQSGFKNRNCSFFNCYVTSDRKYLGSYTKFDVIAFAGPQLIEYEQDLPTKRLLNQKYAFASIESAANYPVCNRVFNDFFNWTWTYKLNSDSRWGYITIRNKKGEIIGPQRDMHWIKLDEMDHINQKLEQTLRNKSIAAAWFVSNCQSKNQRERIARELEIEMKKYNLTLDVYGDCGSMQCPREFSDKCNRKLERDYFFYLSFENSFSEDYVTEKLLHPLKHNVVPIVYGGANYTRFMPDGIYLDIRKLGVAKLAATMNRLIQNISEYSEYFRWKNHYSYHFKSESAETDDYCSICALLNNERKFRSVTLYEHFVDWWNIDQSC